MYYILLIALIHKTVLTYLRFSPLNSLSKNLLNWSFPAGSWSNSSILNAHRFTLRCGISRGFLNILHWKSCIGLYYIAILFHTTIITCTCKLIIKSDSRTLHTIFFPEFFSSFKFIKQKHILLHSMVANCSKDNIIVRMHWKWYQLAYFVIDLQCGGSLTEFSPVPRSLCYQISRDWRGLERL